MTDLAGLYAIIGLQFLGLLVTTWRCDISHWRHGFEAEQSHAHSGQNQVLENKEGGA